MPCTKQCECDFERRARWRHQVRVSKPTQPPTNIQVNPAYWQRREWVCALPSARREYLQIPMQPRPCERQKQHQQQRSNREPGLLKGMKIVFMRSLRNRAIERERAFSPQQSYETLPHESSVTSNREYPCRHQRQTGLPNACRSWLTSH